MRIAAVAGALAVLALAASGLGALVAPSISRARLVTGLVERGSVGGALSAAGTVVPQVEEVVPAPADARITRVVRPAGSLLAKGDPILELDLGMAEVDAHRLDQELALKENAAEKTRLELEDKLSDLASAAKVRRLQLETYRAALARNEKLFAEGLVSEELLRQAELDEARTAVELERLEEQRALAERSAKATLAGLEMERATLRRQRDESARTLAYAVTRADRAGVLTFVADQEGASVRRGDVLARIADLTSFRVDATVADAHARRVAAGMPAIVKTGDARLAGSVARVLPSVQNGLVTLQVALADPKDALLRPNLRVEVDLVTERREGVLRVGRGAFGGAAAELFVVKGDRAFRRHVTFGLAGPDALEVTSGLAEGEEVVLSDMSDYQNLKSIRIRGR